MVSPATYSGYTRAGASGSSLRAQADRDTTSTCSRFSAERRSHSPTRSLWNGSPATVACLRQKLPPRPGSRADPPHPDPKRRDTREHQPGVEVLRVRQVADVMTYGALRRWQPPGSAGNHIRRSSLIFSIHWARVPRHHRSANGRAPIFASSRCDRGGRPLRSSNSASHARRARGSEAVSRRAQVPEESLFSLNGWRRFRGADNARCEAGRRRDLGTARSHAGSRLEASHGVGKA